MLFINNITIKLGIKQKHSIHKQGYPRQKMSLYPKSKELKIPIMETPPHTPQPPGAERLTGDTGESHSVVFFRGQRKSTL